MERAKLIVEPAGAAAVAGALNTLPEPPAPAKQAVAASNVVSLFG
jgi:threonine dehydratase